MYVCLEMKFGLQEGKILLFAGIIKADCSTNKTDSMIS